MAFWLGAYFHGGQALQNTTGIHRSFGLATLAQCGQLHFQVRQFPDALVDMGNVLIEHGIDGATTLGGAICQGQQGVDFPMAHVQCAAVADEAQAFQMVRAIDPEVARRACSLG